MPDRQVCDNQVFSGLYDRNSEKCFQSMELRRCRFESCGLSLTTNVRLRSTVRDLAIWGSVATGCMIGPAVIEDVVIDGLQTPHLPIYGAVFRHVVFKGKIGNLLIHPTIAPGGVKASDQEAF